MIEGWIEAPFGWLLARVEEEAGRPCRLELAPTRERPTDVHGHPAALDPLARQLAEYFRGDRRDFDLELAPVGTRFQQEVWRGLQEIPYGATWSYARLAAHIGRPTALRAVGSANGRNPLPILIPCHRVVAADGGIGGFSGPMAVKRHLLELEGQSSGRLF